MSESKSKADGKHILVQDGERLDGEPIASKDEALAEAQKRQQVQESKGSKAPVEVKQIIHG